MKQILLLPGDGIGPEVVGQAVRVMEKTAELFGIELSFETELIGGCAVDANGTPLSDAAVAVARDSAAILLGAVGGPKWDGNSREQRPETGLLRIRKELGLFANLRPATVYPSMVEASALRPEIVAGVDMLVVPGASAAWPSRRRAGAPRSSATCTRPTCSRCLSSGST